MPRKIKTGVIDSLNGAVVEMSVGVCTMEVARKTAIGEAIPPQKTEKAMIDSGASITLVDSHILKNDLGLSSFQQEIISALDGSGGKFSLYVADLSLTEDGWNRSWNPWTVAGVDLSTKAYKIVIGRDVLAYCQFTYDGEKRTFALSF
jgi:hypothetical protein